MGFHGAKVGYNRTIQLSRGATAIQLAYFLQAWGHQKNYGLKKMVTMWDFHDQLVGI